MFIFRFFQLLAVAKTCLLWSNSDNVINSIIIYSVASSSGPIWLSLCFIVVNGEEWLRKHLEAERFRTLFLLLFGKSQKKGNCSLWHWLRKLHQLNSTSNCCKDTKTTSKDRKEKHLNSCFFLLHEKQYLSGVLFFLFLLMDKIFPVGIVDEKDYIWKYVHFGFCTISELILRDLHTA